MTRRRALAALGAALLASLASVPGARGLTLVGPPTDTVVVEGSAASFALRPTYDSGGAAPLHVFIGYTDANISNPEASADGQASWYNFAIAETAAFRPPEQCTPERNAEHTLAGLGDIQRYLEDYIAKATEAIGAQQPPPRPIAPGPRHACTERFPGFAQSRYPATETIPEAATDSYFDKPTAASACRSDPGSVQCKAYRDHWPAFRGASGLAARDGAFSARAAATPAQRSDALLFGAGDGAAVSIGVARMRSEVRQEGPEVVSEAVATLDDVCIGVTAEGCSLAIDRVRQIARVTRAPGAPITRTSKTLVIGVRAAPAGVDVHADTLMLDQAALDLGGSFQVQAVSKTGMCASDDPAVAVADAGGIMIYGKGGEGGGIMIGGACASARAERVPLPQISVGTGDVGVPGSFVTFPGDTPAEFPAAGGVRFGPSRVVTREVVRSYLADAVAWRTMPYWSSILGMMLVGGALGRRYRDARAVRPVARALDRFARQFLRG